jgi:hypothetical protein
LPAGSTQKPTSRPRSLTPLMVVVPITVAIIDAHHLVLVA